jgi:hypothetical protein
MDDSINAFGEEIGRNAARATYDLLTLHITPGSLIMAGVILGVVAIVTYPRWIEKIDGNGTIRKNFSIRLCDDPVDDKKWKDRVLIVFFGIIAIGFWVYAHQNY